MKKLLILLILPFAALANWSSQEKVKIIRRGENIYLSSNSCYDFQKFVISDNQNINDQFLISCTCQKSCLIDISQLLTPFILKNHLTNYGQLGANCWNTSLRCVGINQFPRYTTPEEISFVLGSPLCRYKYRPSWGDVIAIKDKKGDEVHSFIYISENLGFTKNGFEKTPLELDFLQNIYSSYRVPKRCQGLSHFNEQDQNCERFSEYYSCQSLDEFFSTADENVSLLMVKNLNDEVLTLEEKVSNLFIKGKIERQDFNLLQKMTELQQKIGSIDKKKVKPYSFILKLLNLRIDSLRVQIFMTRDTPK